MASDFLDGILGDAVEDAGTELLSGLIVAGVTGSAKLAMRAARAGFAALTAEEEQVVTEAVDHDPWLCADTTVDAFLHALHDQDQELACAFCAQSLFEHPQRNETLVSTLPSVPNDWSYLTYEELKQTDHGPRYVKFELEVGFEGGTGREPLLLQMYVRWIGEEWKIWKLEWHQI